MAIVVLLLFLMDLTPGSVSNNQATNESTVQFNNSPALRVLVEYQEDHPPPPHHNHFTALFPGTSG